MLCTQTSRLKTVGSYASFMAVKSLYSANCTLESDILRGTLPLLYKSVGTNWANTNSNVNRSGAIFTSEIEEQKPGEPSLPSFDGPACVSSAVYFVPYLVRN